MSLSVLKPGLLSTFQDAGRHGHQHLGIPVSGAMDWRAHALANLLAGNDTRPATLEITLAGPVLRFEAPTCFALAGADLNATLDGEPLAWSRPQWARAGQVLAFGAPRHGARTYLAVHGGFALTPVMGSCSTYVRSALGGWQGRALRAGDRIGLARALPPHVDGLQTLLDSLRIYLPAALGDPARTRLRVLAGAHWDAFSTASQQTLLESEFRISAQADRMGYRLQGPMLALSSARQFLSEAVSFGTVQVPPGGEAIVLMADRQTTGGYPKLAQVASIDLPALAQRLPGATLRFSLIDLETAQRLDQARHAALMTLHDALQPLRACLHAARRPLPEENTP